MRGTSYLAGGLAGIALAARPCLAAEDMISDRNGLEVRRDSFAGLNVSMAFGGAKPRQATARLQLTSVTKVWGPYSSGSVQTHRPRGLELGFDKAAAPVFYVGGQDTATLEQKLGVRGRTGTVLLIVGGVALIVLLVVAAKETAGFGSLPPG